MKNAVSLKARITLITSVLVVAVVGAVLSILGWIVNGQIEETGQQVSDRARQVLNRSLDAQYDALNAATALIADRPGVRSTVDADGPTINDSLNDLNEKVGSDWLVMTDDLGEVLGRSEGAPFNIRDDWSKETRVNTAIDGSSWQGTVQHNSDLAVAVTYPVQKGGYVKATLTAGKQLDTEMLKEIASTAQVELAVYSGSTPVASTRPGFPQLVSVYAGTQRVLIEDEQYVGAVQTLTGSSNSQRLSLLALMPEAVATAPFEPLRRSMWLLLFLGLATAIGIGTWLAKSVTSPLDELMIAAQTLQGGKWPEPFRTTRRDEIGFLQNNFDEMSASLKEGRERLVSMLDVDPLTELWNHRTFKQKLHDSIQVVAELAVVMIDLDEFEEFNSMYGADKGDEALASIAKLVKTTAPEGAYCGRYEGNVFAVALFGEAPSSFAERVRMLIDEESGVTASVGYCSLSDKTPRADLLLLAAKMAVGQAKSAGRNRVREFVGFVAEDDEDSLRRLLRGGSAAAVRALAEAVDAKDAYTRGHSQRVAEYARDLAQQCGYDSGFVELVFLAGTLHDVGKIGVPDDVLNKVSQLTHEEFDKIKLHPELGERIVGQIPELRDTLPGVRNHHERYDGCGYPDGLEGEDIPLIARILAVADAYDAMTSDRPYRKGMSKEVALRIISEGAGTQFDPELAKVFVKIMTSFKEAA